MADRERRVAKIQKRTVDAADIAEATYRVWDSELKGFGMRVTPSGVKTYFVWYRAGSGRKAARREFTIGRHGEFTAEEARGAAKLALSAVRLGKDPQLTRRNARSELSIAELCEQYVAHGMALKKPQTIYIDRRRIEVHIKPLLGRKPISAVTSADVAKFMRDVANGKTAAPVKVTAKELRRRRREGQPIDSDKVEIRRLGDTLARGGKGAATRTVGLLGAIFTYAVKEGLRPDNPVRGVERYKDRQLQCFLSNAELARLGRALATANVNGLNKHGLAVIRLLALTGSRKSEIEALRWAEVDIQRSCLRLADSKTGAKVVPIGAAALLVLAELPRSKTSPFVFPSDKPHAKDEEPKPYVGTPRVWSAVRKIASLDDVRLHDLRHTYASLAASGGWSLQLIGAILGHKDVKTTARYAHLADDPVRLAADRTASAAEAAMAGRPAKIVSITAARR